MILHNVSSLIDATDSPADSRSKIPVVISKSLQSTSAQVLLNKMSDAVVIIDTNGKIEYINHSAARLLGVLFLDSTGAQISSLFNLIEYNSPTLISDPIDWLQHHHTATSSSNFVKLQRIDGKILTVDIKASRLNVNDSTTSNVMLSIRDVSHYQKKLEYLTKAARYDENTQLLRRAELEQRLKRVLETMNAGDQHALLFMDLDRFKQINDTAGHLVGDQALRKVASLFHSQIRERDTLARLGGDEFGLLLEHCPLSLAISRAQALQVVVSSNGFNSNGHHFLLDVSIGIAAFRSSKHSVQTIIEAADCACYNAKRSPGAGRRICSSNIN